MVDLETHDRKVDRLLKLSIQVESLPETLRKVVAHDKFCPSKVCP